MCALSRFAASWCKQSRQKPHFDSRLPCLNIDREMLLLLLLWPFQGFLSILLALSTIPQTTGAFPNRLHANNNRTGEVSDPSFSLLTESISGNENDCVENRFEALELGRQCSRRCRKDIPCENTRKQCLCDGLCGFSCIKPDLSCPELPKIENGNYSPKSSRFNSKAVYQCDPGYYLFGSRERLCQGDEEWSGIPAECLTEPLCKRTIKVNHARNPNDGTYRLNEKVNYLCYPGYQSRGNSEATCKLVDKNQTAWVWGGTPFRCLPKSCGDPGQIDNGKRHGDSFIVSSSVVYTCNEGFEMIGQARRYCQSDNQWSGQSPQCERITCNPTDHLENGKINYAYPLVFNSTVEYACDYGFRLLGPSRRRCGPERKLVGEVPTCEEIDCGQLGPLHNGYIKGYSTRMGDKKEFICLDGTKFIGDHKESACLESGQWSHPLPQCLGSCVVPRVEHVSSLYVVHPGILKDNSSNLVLREAEVGAQVEHGLSLEVICEDSYEMDEQMDNDNKIQPPVCNNSTWSYELKCKPASCVTKPPSPKNGRVRVASMGHGSKGYIHCLDGYRLKGDNLTQCFKGNWTSIDSYCVEIYCGFPGVIEHGRVVLIGLTGNYNYEPYIRRVSHTRQIGYECQSGYKMNDGAPSGATCIDGQWRPEGLPNCIKE